VGQRHFAGGAHHAAADETGIGDGAVPRRRVVRLFPEEALYLRQVTALMKTNQDCMEKLYLHMDEGNPAVDRQSKAPGRRLSRCAPGFALRALAFTTKTPGRTNLQKS